MVYRRGSQRKAANRTGDIAQGRAVNRTRPSAGVTRPSSTRRLGHSWGRLEMKVQALYQSLMSWWRGNKSGRLFLNVFFLLHRSLLPGIRALCQTGRDVNSLFLHRSPPPPPPPQRLRHRRPHSPLLFTVFSSPPLVPVPVAPPTPRCTYPPPPPPPPAPAPPNDRHPGVAHLPAPPHARNNA